MFEFSEFKEKLEKIIAHTKQELSTLRTGKASVQMLDPVKVEAYGSFMAVNELANISVPDSSLITINPWDKNMLEPIEKAIQKAGLNLNPVVDQDIIRIVIAPLTEEKRHELVKQLHQRVESAKAMMRSERADVKSEVEEQEGDSGVSEDDIHRDLQEMEKMVDEFEQQLEEMSKQKEEDLLAL